MRKLIIPLLIFIITCALLIGGYFYLSVKEIVVEGVKELQGVDSLSKKNILFLDVETAEAQIIDKNPTIQAAHVLKKYPHTILVTVVTAAPVAKLLLEDGYMSLSSEGKIISKEKNDIPSIKVTISYYQPLYFRNYVIGEVIDIDEVVKSIYFIEETQKLAIPVSTIDIRNENMIVLISAEREILLSATKNVQQQVAQLKVVMEQFRTKALGFSKLDLRFEKPVVVFTK